MRRSLFAGIVALAAMTVAAPGTAAAQGNRRGENYFPNLPVVTQDGKTLKFYDDVIKGKIVLISFIYTNCQDICPLTTARLTQVEDELGDIVGREIFFVSVTVDPERDTPELLGKYVPAFDPSFIGLYGDAEAIARTAKEFKVFYKKVPGSSPTNYSVDHTAALYVYDPSGRLRLFAKHAQGADALAQDIKLLLDQAR